MDFDLCEVGNEALTSYGADNEARLLLEVLHHLK